MASSVCRGCLLSGTLTTPCTTPRANPWLRISNCLFANAGLFKTFKPAQKALLLHCRRHFCCTAEGTSVAQQKALLLHCRRHFCCTAEGTSVALQKALLLHCRRHFCCTAEGTSVALQKALLLHRRRHFCCTAEGTSVALQKALLLHCRNLDSQGLLPAVRLTTWNGVILNIHRQQIEELKPSCFAFKAHGYCRHRLQNEKWNSKPRYDYWSFSLSWFRASSGVREQILSVGRLLFWGEGLFFVTSYRLCRWHLHTYLPTYIHTYIHSYVST